VAQLLEATNLMVVPIVCLPLLVAAAVVGFVWAPLQPEFKEQVLKIRVSREPNVNL